MKKVIAFLLLLVLTMAIIGFKHSYDEKISKLNQQINQCQEKLTESKSETKNLNDLYFLVQRNVSEKTIAKGKLYFDYQTVKQEDGYYKISIYLKGDRQAGADAADFSASLDNFKIRYIVSGSAFPAYPRQLSTDDSLLVTGVASLSGSKFVYGTPDNLFVEFIGEKINAEKESKITTDSTGTSIYFDGENILDDEMSLNEIIVN